MTDDIDTRDEFDEFDEFTEALGVYVGPGHHQGSSRAALAWISGRMASESRASRQ